MIRKILMLLGVICVPIALAFASQSLASTAEPPQLPEETVSVQLRGSGEPSEPAASASPTAAPSGSSGPRDASSSASDQPSPSADASPVPVPEAPANPGVSVPNVGEIPQQVYQNPQPVPVPGEDDMDDEMDGEIDD
ncbi:hypothetical protein VVR84_10355 [Kocuria carniphila]|uniref:Uncharacterized protein n=1 Tax=Kocuria carniphila TaxID=262208 RepID=A0ABV3V3E9_9MICC|nr:hypothetical protein [Kocuria carniphila]